MLSFIATVLLIIALSWTHEAFLLQLTSILLGLTCGGFWSLLPMYILKEGGIKSFLPCWGISQLVNVVGGLFLKEVFVMIGPTHIWGVLFVLFVCSCGAMVAAVVAWAE